MKIEIEMKTFSTYDLYLAAALKVHAFRLVDIKQDSARAMFIFEDRDDRIEKVRHFFSGELQGSLKAYVDAWSSFRAMISEVGIVMEKRNATPARK